MNWKAFLPWFKGVAAAFLGGALGVLSDAVTEDAPFTSWRKMAIKAIVGGGATLYAYLKEPPRKSPDTEKPVEETNAKSE